MRWNLAILLVVVALVAAGLFGDSWGETPRPIEIDPGPALSREAFAEGLELFKAERYAEARGKFEQVLSQGLTRAPEVGERAREYLKAALREEKVQASREASRRALIEGDLPLALEALTAVPEQSLQLQEIDATRKALSGLNDRIGGLEGKARGVALKRLREVAPGAGAPEAVAAAVEQGVVDHLRTLHEQMKALLHPDPASNRDAAASTESRKAAIRAIFERAQAFRSFFAERGHPVFSEIEEIYERTYRDHDGGCFLPVQTPHAESLLQPVRALFDRQAFEAAAKRLDEIVRDTKRPKLRPKVLKEAKKIQAALRRFVPRYERAMVARQARAIDRAIPELMAAEVEARTIFDEGRLHRQIRKDLADLHYLRGRRARNADDLAGAFEQWSRSLQMKPDHPYSQDGIRELKREARTLYLKAYTLRAENPHEARQLFRELQRFTPPDYEYHQKARMQLKKLRAR